MNIDRALSRMVAPSQKRPSIFRQGIIQILVTRACDRACCSCTQGSQLAGRPNVMSVDHFRQACESLMHSKPSYFGVVGMFGGNPAVHKDFGELCRMMREIVPWEQRGIWSNHPITLDNARMMAITFNPAVSNLNVHQSQEAWDTFAKGWPDSKKHLKGLEEDSRHVPPFVGMRDAGVPESEMWDMVSKCDINQYWSALIGEFRGELRAWFCEIAAAQAMLHQWDRSRMEAEVDYLNEKGNLTVLDKGKVSVYTYPDTGMPLWDDQHRPWWWAKMQDFRNQVEKHCPECGIPMKGYGALANSDGPEQVSQVHQGIYNPKRKGRKVELVVIREQLNEGRLPKAIDYIQNSQR